MHAYYINGDFLNRNVTLAVTMPHNGRLLPVEPLPYIAIRASRE